MTLASQKLASELHISGSTLRATARAHPQQHNMIQRSLLRQLRASSSRLQKPSVFSSPRLSFPAPRIPALSSRQQLYPRCYSTTAEAKASPEGETSAAEAKPSPRAETSAAEEAPSEAKEAGEDPIQKELAATKAQVIDLKVRPPPCILPTPEHPSLIPSPLPSRTNTSAPSPTSATSKTAQSATSNRPKTSPSRASPKTWSKASTTSTGPSRPSPPKSSTPHQHPSPKPLPPRAPPLTKTSSTCTKA